MKLTDVKGVGQTAAGKLGAAGIGTVEEMARIDLRQTDVTGLSTNNLVKLRENAQMLLEAVETGELTLVGGLGPSAADKLHAAGVETIDQLLGLDLRTESVEGLSTENLQRLKRNAEYLDPD